jgi:hypothetical protein
MGELVPVGDQRTRCLWQNIATAIVVSLSDVMAPALPSPNTIVASDILAHSSAAGSGETLGAISFQAASYAAKIILRASGSKEVGRSV